MGDTVKTIIYSAIGIVSILALMTSFWLGYENRRIYSQYVEERAIWYQKNRDLEFKVDKLSAELERLQGEFQQARSLMEKFKEE